ncbi:30S ribosomal protein S12 methylthiotransferase RimO [Mesoterricola silvestris]|uniref:Ribosomal protein uS12 methylthiotransferase RimO n=1 Tax=Mesoterricola silvestris TaxID=2927979 RepID=A0AA48GMW1_9BACT|nr:30S ribosomal protein S12 methylthiotransferase RimO [Mesoterricola silvestris]BDU70920.1 ribosomal protein S12 methylthiotransferase RimO [Mesoterricola silvestris]
MAKVGFMSLGCPKNLVDSEVMLGHLRLKGFTITPDPAQAEILVVNTCGFIESAKKESIEAILQAASHKKTGACRKLVVAGCMVERYRDQLLADMPEIDACLGTRDIEHIAEVLGASDRLFEPERDPGYLYTEASPRLLTTPKASAYLKISEGCDHSCAFCIIPAIRGPQRSRSIDSVVAEARNLVAGGALEINLVGQDTTDFGRDLGDPDALEKLVRALGGVEGLRWFRIHYAYPNRLTDGLLHAIAETPNCAKYLDMPLQHGDAAVLKAMARGGGRKPFLKLLEKARRIVPDVFIRSNFIVGFPSEDEAAFGELRAFVEEARFEHVGVFTYSLEEGTPAFALGDPVPARTKNSRKRILMELQQKICRDRNRGLEGRVLDVLVEGTHEETDMVFKGRHMGQAPEVDGGVLIVGGDVVPGTIQPVRITKGHAYDLVGEVVEGGAEEAVRRYEESRRSRS